MHKKSAGFLILFSLAAFCFCKEPPTFTVSPFAGWNVCSLDEILYDTDDNLRSLLEWDQKNLFETGLCLTVTFPKCQAALLFSYSFPTAQGKMTDSDRSAGQKYSETKHPVLKTKNINTQFDFSYTVFQNDFFTLAPALQVQYLYSSFNAGNGEGIRNGRNIKVYGIDYYRHSVFSFLGVQTKFQLLPKLYLGADFLVSPFCYQNGFDYHQGVANPFSSRDIQKGFFSKFKTTANAGFDFNERLALETQFSVIWGSTDKGILYTDYFSGSMALAWEKSGSRILYWGGRVFLKIRVF